VTRGRRDSSSWETLSCSESCDVHTTTIFSELVSNGPAPAGAAGRHLCRHTILFVFTYHGPLHRCVIRVYVNLNPTYLNVYPVRCSMTWTSISILCSPSSFCVPQVLRIATIATTNVALAKDEPLGGCCNMHNAVRARVSGTDAGASLRAGAGFGTGTCAGVGD